MFSYYYSFYISVSPQHVKEVYTAQLNYASDNVDISRHPVNVGWVPSSEQLIPQI